MIRLLPRLLAGCPLFVAVAGFSQDNEPQTPPEPPIVVAKGSTPIVYRSNVGDFVNKDKKTEGFLVYKEWWYWSKEIEGTVVTGIAEVTLTPTPDVAEPTGGGLHYFSVTLDNNSNGDDCRPYKHDPDTNNSPIQVGGSLTGQFGGGSNVQLGVGVQGTARDDKVTIEDFRPSQRSARWDADVGGGRKKSGANALVFTASWICPKYRAIGGEVLPGQGYGYAVFDWWFSPDKKYFFSPTTARPLLGSAPPGGAKTECHEYIYKKDVYGKFHWVCTPEQVEGASKTAEQKPSGTGATQQPSKQVGQAPLKQENPEQRVARADAIKALRTGLADRSGTEVMPAFPTNPVDSSGQTAADVANRVNDVAKQEEKRSQGNGSVPNRATPASAGAPQSADTQRSVAPSAPAASGRSGGTTNTEASTKSTNPSPTPQHGLAGTYRLTDTSGGVTQLRITESNGRYTVTGLGEPMPLQKIGDVYCADNGVLFGKPIRNIQMRQTGSNLMLSASDEKGQIIRRALAAEPQ